MENSSSGESTLAKSGSFTIERDGFRFWMPQGRPPGDSVFLASSRLGRKLDRMDSLFDALRTIAAELSSRDRFLVTAAGVALDRFVRRIGYLFDIPVVELIPDELSEDSDTCERRYESVALGDRGAWPCYFRIQSGIGERKRKKSRVAVDPLLMSLADEVVLMSVRKGGNIHSAARRRLEDGRNRITRCLIDRRLTRPSVSETLLSDGAIAWWLVRDEADGLTEAENQDNHFEGAVLSGIRAPIVDRSEIRQDEYLLHWTRRRAGPWPDQGEAEYLDDLIFRSQRRNHGGLNSLARILAAGKILATGRWVRESRPVVSFSEIPLDQIVHRRKFRSHLARWDFEPFGIAVKRDCLVRSGARSVIYGDETTWLQLEAEDRTFFQPEKSRDGKIDWRDEKEWRLPGNLDLSRLTSDDALVFVDTPASAKQISALSRWPVVSIADGNST